MKAPLLLLATVVSLAPAVFAETPALAGATRQRWTELKSSIPDLAERPAALQAAAASLPKRVSPVLIKADLERLPPLAAGLHEEVAQRGIKEFDTYQVLGVAWRMTRNAPGEKALVRDLVVKQLDEIGWIDFQAEPAGCTLVVDDIPTPPSRNGFFAVDPGKHVLTARKTGYADAPITEIRSESGAATAYQPKLVKQ